MYDDTIVLTDSNGNPYTRSHMEKYVASVNEKMQHKYKGHYRVVFRWSNYWGQCMFYLQMRWGWFFWRYVRNRDYKNSCDPWGTVECSNAELYFPKCVIPDLEKRRLLGHIMIS